MLAKRFLKRLNSTQIEAVCIDCGAAHEIALTKEQQERWLGGGLIQRVAPELLPDERELLISGLCPICWGKRIEMFLDEEERIK